MVEKITELYKEIADVYTEKLKTSADGYEELRKKIHTRFYVFNSIGIFCFAYFLFIIIFTPNYTFTLYEGGGWSNILNAILLALHFFPAIAPYLAIALMITAQVQRHLFISKIKKEFYPAIFKAIDNDLSYFSVQVKFLPRWFQTMQVCGVPVGFAQDIINDILYSKKKAEYNLPQVEGLEVLPKHNIFTPDDIITGKYCNRAVTIIEFDLRYQNCDNKNGEEQIYTPQKVFHGALFQTSMEKPVKGRIYLKQHNTDASILSSLRALKLEKVTLESNEFNKIYQVYSDNQIEARYFLTTSIMEKLIRLYEQGQTVSISIHNKDISIFKKTRQDLFEPNLNKPINNAGTYYEIIAQAKSILEFIKELKLDNTTGL